MALLQSPCDKLSQAQGDWGIVHNQSFFGRKFCRITRFCRVPFFHFSHPSTEIKVKNQEAPNHYLPICDPVWAALLGDPWGTSQTFFIIIIVYQT